MPNILIVDDEAGIRDSLAGVLTDEGYSASSAESGEACLERLRKGAFDVVLLDIWLPGIDGLETLERIRQLDNPPEVIMISGHGTIETAVRATKLGAYDFLEKPLSLDKTLILVKNAVESKKLERENVDLKKQLHARSTIVGDSIPMKALRQQIGLMAPTNGRVLIYGESGSGKELVAHAIHAQSLRKEQTFVEVNCAAIPEDLIESELFGHHKGSFSGAATDKEGKFQKANEGTLFLDEVGDMSLKTQSKVLRTLEEQRFIPVGSEETITVDVRVIASTNKDLEEEISKGNFREDLFYRIHVVVIELPPLRERQDDIAPLSRHFAARLAQRFGRPLSLGEDAIAWLEQQPWPGNVRELENAIERAAVLNEKPLLERGDFNTVPPRHEVERASGGEDSGGTLKSVVEDAERRAIIDALKATDGNRRAAAERLGVSLRTLFYKIDRYGLA